MKLIKILVITGTILIGLLLMNSSVKGYDAIVNSSNVYIVLNDAIEQSENKRFYYVVYDYTTFASMSTEKLENDVWIIDEITLSGQTELESNLFNEWYYSLTLVTIDNLPSLDSAYNVEFAQTPVYTIYLPMVAK